MASAYKLTATPFLFVDGQFKGEMRNVTFTAQSPTETERWFAINCGQFERAFSDLVGVNAARQMMSALSRGEDIEFPDLYQMEEFDYRFDHRNSTKH